MTNQHLIIPPPELVQEWLCSDDYLWGPLEQTSITITTNRLQNVATRATQWGSDQELDACCEWLDEKTIINGSTALRMARRPKPPSIKDQALEELEQLRGDANSMGMGFDAPAIRRALEALPND